LAELDLLVYRKETQAVIEARKKIKSSCLIMFITHQ